MKQQEYEELERTLYEAEPEFEDHNENGLCHCSECEQYRLIESRYQAEQSRRDDK